MTSRVCSLCHIMCLITSRCQFLCSSTPLIRLNTNMTTHTCVTETDWEKADSDIMTSSNGHFSEKELKTEMKGRRENERMEKRKSRGSALNIVEKKKRSSLASVFSTSIVKNTPLFHSCSLLHSPPSPLISPACDLLVHEVQMNTLDVK